MLDYADKFLKAAVGLGVLAAGAGVGYRYGIYLPQVEAAKVATAAQEIARGKNRQEEYKSCKWTALSSYADSQMRECTRRGQALDCKLPNHLLSEMEQNFDDAKQICLEEFKSE